jgi:DNA repair protein RecN (Recombination protein N)
LSHQTAEIAAAELDDVDEEQKLDVLEDELSNAASHREAASVVVSELADDGRVLDRIRSARAQIDLDGPFGAEATRLDAVLAEADDIVATLRDAGESLVDDPEGLAMVRERRHLLFELRRKYGDTLDEVMIFADEAGARLEELISSDETSRRLAAERDDVLSEIAKAAAQVRSERVAAAPELASAVEARLGSLAMQRARISIEVDGDDGSDVEFRLAANSGAALQPISKVASGGELARTMLAMQLELNTGPDTLIFDEVDAGIGGETGLTVGAALAEVAAGNQVLVITHLAQVAAYADHQITVSKSDDGTTAIAEVALLSVQDRIGELSRMLGGDESSTSGRTHAAELLASAAPRG